MKKIRLQKYLSSCGVASRRKSEEIIKSGKIRVNGEVITQMGFTVSSEDKVEYYGEILKPQDFVYIILNKPRSVICSKKDYLNRKTIYDIIKEDHEVFSIGRLDYESCGLIILTNDGDFANSIMHPSNSIVKTYIVKSFDKVKKELIDNFTSGITIDGIEYKAKKIEKIKDDRLKILLNEGKKREIREVYKFFNIKIEELKRLCIGNLNMDKLNLRIGEYRYLNKRELEMLIYEKDSYSN